MEGVGYNTNKQYIKVIRKAARIFTTPLMHDVTTRHAAGKWPRTARAYTVMTNGSGATWQARPSAHTGTRHVSTSATNSAQTKVHPPMYASIYKRIHPPTHVRIHSSSHPCTRHSSVYPCIHPSILHRCTHTYFRRRGTSRPG